MIRIGANGILLIMEVLQRLDPYRNYNHMTPGMAFPYIKRSESATAGIIKVGTSMLGKIY